MSLSGESLNYAEEEQCFKKNLQVPLVSSKEASDTVAFATPRFERNPRVFDITHEKLNFAPKGKRLLLLTLEDASPSQQQKL